MTAEGLEPVYWTSILYDVAHVLESVEDPEARIDRILALMRRFVPYDRCALLEASPTLNRVISIAPADASPEVRDLLAARVRGMLELISGSSLEEIRRGSSHRELGRAHLAVPIIGLGETTGMLVVEQAGGGLYEESHLAFLSVIAAQIGAYLTAVRAARELRASEARFRGLYESGMIGIAFMDASGTITEANETFASIVARSGAELQVSLVNWHDLAPPDDLAHNQTAIREAVERGTCRPYKRRFIREDGREVTALAGVALLATNSLVAFVLDVSEREQVERDRADLLKQRGDDLELLQMFMAMLGHDLRNPLSAVKMAAEHLQHSASDPVARQVSRILSSTDRVERMVDLLLDLTQIRLAGGMPVERRPVDLGALCHRAIEELRTP